jgi:ribonuclease E
MGSKMLIDATHVEETRVVVVRGTRIEEFDFESAARKQLKGNIYLAKVTRVEPSLQAAFVDYGGNRHGFLAFSEIHPDYYQIPVADRQALIREEEEAQRHAEDDAGNGDSVEGDTLQSEPAAAGSPDQERTRGFSEESGEEFTSTAEEGQPSSETADSNGQADALEIPASDNGLSENGEGVETVEEDAETQKIESVGAEDALEELPRARRTQRRSYKIQEVIKRRQVILVQVVKEERGNKGAALTTYLSLAGRYCVLMPNTARGGGISRKITDANDRRRLKEVTRDIEVPEGMGLIVRTAGAQRTRTEIKRDFDYLLRLWENVRDLTLSSTAPALVYEEGNLIKRAIRDLYTKDVEEIFVEGEDAYREAKDFMKMLMPSHARNVKLYKDTRPLFSRYQVETQLDSLFSHTVTLQSGGYMVINQTEALVSIDINSGKATREHNIEDTALKTNLEASDEIARQLRLRDLAGLVVIDFIDMEEKRNNRSVERRLKDALKHDRARIQVGRISHFGLLEMSRQRLRPSLLEGSTRMCPTCDGRGMVRSVSSCALSVLRAVEEHLISKKPENLTVKTNREVASYILNDKRDHLLTLEADYQVSIFIVPSEEVKGSQAMIERAGERTVTVRKPQAAPVKLDSAFEEQEVPEAEEEQQEPAFARPAQPEGRPAEQPASAEAESGAVRKRRRRGRRGRRSDKPEGTPVQVSKEEVPGLGEQPDIALPDAANEGKLPEQREERVAQQEDSSFSRDLEPPVVTNGSADVARAPARPEEATGDSAPDTVTPPSEPEGGPKPTRWQPPAPTVAAQQARPKAGWWSKRQA